MSNEMQLLLNENPEFRQYLFPRGFLLTDSDKINTSVYPFYGKWSETKFFEYSFLVHPKQKIHTFLSDNTGVALVGHAYDPFFDEYREDKLLEKLFEAFSRGEDNFYNAFNNWTGVFALFVYKNGELKIFGDPAGMYTVFYGKCAENFYVSSHTKLLGDICNLSFDSYIEHLVNYKFYSLFGKTLPGDLSPYKEFKRLIPNHFAEYADKDIRAERFFPRNGDSLVTLPYDQIVEKAATVLSGNMALIHKKWDRCAISLTGGCDSKTTLSCTTGNYDKYACFSYTSSESEDVDANAAAKICEICGLKHAIYTISDKDSDFKDIEVFRRLLEYNSGCIGKPNANDVRKRKYFVDRDLFDVEVKSWVSEVGRAYYHKRFAKRKFPQKLTPRYATTLYKVFLTDRKLVKETDAVFKDYLEKYFTEKDFEICPWYDLLFWEFRMSSWNGLVITGEQQIAFDITIPYNNRRLLWLLLATPVEKRITDEVHYEIIKKMNSKIYNCGISVVNVKHTQKRAKLERIYLELHSKIYF